MTTLSGKLQFLSPACDVATESLLLKVSSICVGIHCYSAFGHPVVGVLNMTPPPTLLWVVQQHLWHTSGRWKTNLSCYLENRSTGNTHWQSLQYNSDIIWEKYIKLTLQHIAYSMSKQWLPNCFRPQNRFKGNLLSWHPKPSDLRYNMHISTQMLMGF